MSLSFSDLSKLKGRVSFLTFNRGASALARLDISRRALPSPTLLFLGPDLVGASSSDSAGDDTVGRTDDSGIGIIDLVLRFELGLLRLKKPDPSLGDTATPISSGLILFRQKLRLL